MIESKKVVFYKDELFDFEISIKNITAQNLLSSLTKKFPNEEFIIDKIIYHENGIFKVPNKNIISMLFGQKDIKGLPKFVEIVIKHKTGSIYENIITWCPYKWNYRFMGTAGGGMAIGGYSQIYEPNNAARGMTLVKAILNGFSASTSDAGIDKTKYGFISDNEINDDLISNWIERSTHNMALFGKAITEIVYNESIKFSYLHGGSGGGRQSMAEAQKYPDDFDGIWASCPAINWTKFMLLGYYYLAVMNDNKNYLTLNKINFFMKEAQNYFGSSENYYNTYLKSEYNPYSSINKKIKHETITELDSKTIDEIWNGPKIDGIHIDNFRKGVQFWHNLLPICALYYNPFKKYPTDSSMYRHYLRLLVKDKNRKFNNITKDEFYKLYKDVLTQYKNHLIDDYKLDDQLNKNKKIIIDHGTDDPLIPVDGTITYYKNVVDYFKDINIVDKFMKVFITPGDGHGNCNYHNAGLTESDGMIALINWVEKNIEPSDTRIVQVDKKGNLIKESTVKPYKINM